MTHKQYFKQAFIFLIIYYVGYAIALLSGALLIYQFGTGLLSPYLWLTYGTLSVVGIYSVVLFFKGYKTLNSPISAKDRKFMNRYLFILLFALIVGFGFMRPFGHGMATLLSDVIPIFGSLAVEAFINALFLLASGVAGFIIIYIQPRNSYFSTRKERILLQVTLLAYLMAFVVLFVSGFSMTHPSPFALLALSTFLLYWNQPRLKSNGPKGEYFEGIL